MGILKTLYLVFKADTTDIKKARQEVNTSVDQISKRFGSLDDASKKIGDSFLGATKQLIGFAAAAVSLGAIISGFKQSIDYASTLNVQAKQLGVNISELDAYGNAVRRFGGDTNSFVASIKALSHYTGNNPALALKVLPQLADMFQRVGKFRSQVYGRSIGLDEGTILLLQQGRREVQSLVESYRQLGVITQKSADTIQIFKNSLQATQVGVKGLYYEIADSLLPVLSQLLNNYITPTVEYLLSHKDLVIGALFGIAIAAAAIAAPFIVASLPIIAMTAAIGILIAAFAIAYEDIKRFEAGQSSVTGVILKRWPVVGRVVSGILSVWKDQILALINPLLAIEKIFSKLGAFFGANKELKINVEDAQNLLGVAGSSQAAGLLNANSFISNSNARNNTVNTGPITVNTQATDGNGVAAQLGKGLQVHFWQSNSNFDNGQLA